MAFWASLAGQSPGLRDSQTTTMTTTDKTHLTTLTHSFETPDDTDLDLADIEVDVFGQPPADLADAVHTAFESTIIHLCDHTDLYWSQDDDGNWRLRLGNGFPEQFGTSGWLPPYRTREQFEGADGSGDGLLGNLPDGWSYEIQNASTLVFIHD